MNRMLNCTTAIIGAGPAGLFAAETLAQAGRDVVVFHRMRQPGRRLLLAGRGGLNLTHSQDLAQFHRQYGAALPHLAPALATFPPAKLRDWADGLGAATFIGSSGRVFPSYLKTSPLLRAWMARLDSLQVRFAMRHHWLGFAPQGDVIFATEAGPVEVTATQTLLALGGAAWPKLGADGGWTRILAAEAVPITPFRPANAGIVLNWSPHLRALAGTPVHNLTANGARGVILITETGLEGGAIYAACAALRDELEATGKASLTLDLRPDTTLVEVQAKLTRTRARDSAANRLRKGLSLDTAAIALLHEAALLAHGRSPTLPQDPAALAHAVKNLRLPVQGIASLERAISSAGGLGWAGLNPDFSLKNRPNVFVAGEMLDWEAPTGGYLLQACFATAHWAARGMLAQG